MLSFIRDELAPAVCGDVYWSSKVELLLQETPPIPGMHLAVLIEPYLEFILNGLKSVESRFSMKRLPPYRSLERGDVILLKRSSGPIVGIAEVSDHWFYRLDPESWHFIRSEFAAALCAEDP